MAVRSREVCLAISANRRGFLHLKELSAIQTAVKSFNMLDKDVWVDFMMKLDTLSSSTDIHVSYTPYQPDAGNADERGFKAFLQVHSFSIN